jgi:hypothetical protein
MNHPAWHSEDARWLRRWLRRNLVCAMSLLGLLLLVRFQSQQPPDVKTLAEFREVRLLSIPGYLGMPDDGRGLLATDRLPPETELVYLPTRSPNPVAPQGWRRTDRGWENASSWRLAARSLAEIVKAQESREPMWMNRLLAGLRGVPPLAYAFLQIAAIAGIIAISRRAKPKSHDASSARRNAAGH